ncbi:MAG TPA: extracellular solute-binding protein, partial [Roseiflexaceae bacterium]|nr:extracellular solute-binding protein [Roseiflexaceae bacterium]
APTAASGEAAPTAAPAAGGEAMAAPKIAVEDGAVLRVSSWGNPSEQKVNTDSFDRFKQLYPNITINYEPQPDQFQTKIKADFSGNTEPDVFYLDSSLMTALAPENLLLPLDDYLAEGGVKTDDYVGDLVSLFQQDGKTYALPKDQGSLALFINNDIAQKAGVDPASLKTWDDVTAAAKKMTSGEGPAKVYGMCVDRDIQRGGAFMLQNGNPIVENGKATVDQPTAVDAVNWWYGFKKDGTGQEAKEIGAGWCGEAFGKQQVAMAVEGGWLLPFMADSANGFQNVKFTAQPIPTPANGKQATLVFTNGWAASARTKYPKAAAALVLFLTSAANQKPILETGFALPTVKSLLNDPYFEQNPAAKVLAEAPSYGKVADLVFGGPAKKDDVIKPLNDAMERIFTGAQDVQTSLTQGAQEADAVLSQ